MSVTARAILLKPYFCPMNKNNKYYLGLDLGTSSLKGIYKIPGGDSFTAKIPYSENTVENWLSALEKFFADTPQEIRKNVGAVSISSQVGTYITEENKVIPWFSDPGKEELEIIKNTFSDEECIDALNMKHPDIISYPLPRLLYLKAHNSGNVLQMPKELLIRHLTGNFVTDYFSMRGIADIKKGYAKGMLTKLDLSPELPKLSSPFESAGTVLPSIAKQYGLPEGIRVFSGCNDFFAGLLGMGVYDIGTAFDISGTSEHFGYISNQRNDSPVSGPYFNGFCSYGGTKSSGTSCDFAIKNFGKDIDLNFAKDQSTPIFLPYLHGERAPIFDEDARGVFFGINSSTTKKQMAYSVFEGVVFSLYDIANSVNLPKPEVLICGGGSAKDVAMNRLRAEIMGCNVKAVSDNDASALGASLIAMVGSGVYEDLPQCIKENVSYSEEIKYTGLFTEILNKRFEIFKNVYQALKPTFKHYQKIYGGYEK